MHSLQCHSTSAVITIFVTEFPLDISTYRNGIDELTCQYSLLAWSGGHDDSVSKPIEKRNTLAPFPKVECYRGRSGSLNTSNDT